jgi:hypothetical protein
MGFLPVILMGVYNYFARSPPTTKKAMRDYIDLLNRNNNDARLGAQAAELNDEGGEQYQA